MKPPALDATGLHDLLAAAVAAPSMHNTEPWRFRLRSRTRTVEIHAAELDVVHAWKPDVDLSDFSVIMDAGAGQCRAEAQLGMEVVLLEEHAPGDVHLSGRTVATTATRALLDAAMHADLLVVGARKHRGWIGPVTHALLHHSRSQWRSCRAQNR